MSYVSRPNSTACPNAAQNTRLRNWKNCQMPNLQRIKQLHFITRGPKYQPNACYTVQSTLRKKVWR